MRIESSLSLGHLAVGRAGDIRSFEAFQSYTLLRCLSAQLLLNKSTGCRVHENRVWREVSLRSSIRRVREASPAPLSPSLLSCQSKRLPNSRIHPCKWGYRPRLIREIQRTF